MVKRWGASFDFFLGLIMPREKLVNIIRPIKKKKKSLDKVLPQKLLELSHHRIDELLTGETKTTVKKKKKTLFWQENYK